ncbi:MAG: Abi-alpha family protein [Alloacidobacterium sp.]|jgi:hypothetical protein
MTETGEIIKSGAGEKIADLVNKLAGPLAEEVGLMLGDKVRVYRVKNWIKTVEKTERLLRDSGLPANAVPPRLFLPIMEAASIEDNETLQDMWAGLLATASQDTDTVSPSFVETLKQLTPDEARYLQRLQDQALKEKRERYDDDDAWKKVLKKYPKVMLAWDKSVANFPIAATAFPTIRHMSQLGPDTYERLGLIRRMYEVTSSDASRDALVDEGHDPFDATEIVYQFVFTEYADKFLRACQGPSEAGSGPDATTPKTGH